MSPWEWGGIFFKECLLMYYMCLELLKTCFLWVKLPHKGIFFSSKTMSAWSKTCTKKLLDKAHTKTNFTSYSAEQNWTQRSMSMLLILEIATPSWRQRSTLKLLVMEKTTFICGTSGWAISMWRTSNC